MNNNEDTNLLDPSINSEENHDNLRRRRFQRLLPLMGFTICFYIGSIGGSTLLPQYLLDRLRHEENVSVLDNGTLHPCSANISDPAYIREQKLQEKSSVLLAQSTFAEGIPSLFTVFLYGVLSDLLGRKFVMTFPYIGLLMMTLTITLMCNLNWPFYVYIIISFFNGCFGSYSTMLAGTFAYMADITPKEKRSVTIGLIEGCLGISTVITNLLLGWMIKVGGYGNAMIGLCTLVVISIVLLFLVKETRIKRDNGMSTDARCCSNMCTTMVAQLTNIRVLLLFNKQRSVCLLLVVVAFTIHMFVYVGTMSITTLFLMNRPFCWNSVYLGYFNAIKTVMLMIGGYGTVVFLRKRISDANIVLLSLISFFIKNLLQAIASMVDPPFCNILMLIAAVAGFMTIAAPIMMRAMCSKLVTEDEQGAVFGLIATGEAFSFSFGSVTMSSTYSVTVEYVTGFIYFLCVGLIIIMFILITIYKVVSQRGQSFSQLSNVVG